MDKFEATKAGIDGEWVCPVGEPYLKITFRRDTYEWVTEPGNGAVAPMSLSFRDWRVVEGPEPEEPEPQLVHCPVRNNRGWLYYHPESAGITSAKFVVTRAPADVRFGRFVGYEVRDPVRDETFLSLAWPTFRPDDDYVQTTLSEENISSGKLVRCELVSCVFQVEEGDDG